MQHEVFGRRQVILSDFAPSFFIVPITVGLIAFGCAAAPPEASVVVAREGEAPGILEIAPSASETSAPQAAKPVAIAWETSEENARAMARKRRSPLVIFLFAAWVAASAAMDRTTWSDPRVIDALAPFVSLRIDLTNADGPAESLSRSYDARMLPTTLVFDDRGSEIARFEGYLEPERILKLLATVPPPEN